MVHALIGGVLVAILYTFFPALAVKPSAWLRAAYAWLKSLRKDGVGDADDYKAGGTD